MPTAESSEVVPDAVPEPQLEAPNTVVVPCLKPQFTEGLRAINASRSALHAFIQQAMDEYEQRHKRLQLDEAHIWDEMRKEYDLSETKIYHVNNQNQLLYVDDTDELARERAEDERKKQ